MHDDVERYWRDVVRILRDALHLRPLGKVEAERAYRGATAASLSDAEIAQLVSCAAHGASPMTGEDENSLGDIDMTDARVGEEVLQLNRNKGAENEEIKQRLAAHRRRLLGNGTDAKPKD